MISGQLWSKTYRIGVSSPICKRSETIRINSSILFHEPVDKNKSTLWSITDIFAIISKQKSLGHIIPHGTNGSFDKTECETVQWINESNIGYEISESKSNKSI